MGKRAAPIRSLTVALVVPCCCHTGAADFEGEAGPEPAPGWEEIIKECLEDDPANRCVDC